MRGVGEVRREHHVRPSLPDLQLVLERARRPAQIRLGDRVEDGLAGRGDLPRERPETLHSPADADVERHPAARKQPVGTATAARDRQTETQASRRASV